VPGLGLLDTDGDGVGDSLPASINPRLNLNDQSWSLPFEATNTVFQLGVKTRLGDAWNAQASLAMQRTLINDRIAFPDGCSNAATYVYPGLCANGDVDVYDFRSEGEERNSWGWDARANRALNWLGMGHQITLGVSGRGNRDDLQALQAYNYVGSSNIYAPVALPSDALAQDKNTNSRQRSVDGFVTLVTDVTANVQTLAGLRTTTLSRRSARSDGSRAVAFDQTITTPWVAASWQLSSAHNVYASWGQGVELESVPNRPTQFVNYGETLPALKSEQVELGWKWLIKPRVSFSAALFTIEKPYADDVPSATGLPTRIVGAKKARHQGLELALQGRLSSQLSVQSTISLLDAKFVQALDPALVGQRITNVPKLKASMFADYKIASLPGLSVHGLLGYEDGKTANANGSASLPSAVQLDLGLRYAHRFSGKAVRWQLSIENASDRTYWREAPTQSWGGVYLFPSTPRTVRASVALDF
jgi:iron complex outermembrane receptor protein